MEFAAISLDTLGKVMVSYTVLQVHYRMWLEHKIDAKVYKEMKHERSIGLLGILFIILGYVLHFVRTFFP